ncbi:Bromo adjacent homology (BAH) domain-containing protein [Dioscorea alata]|nr:Bromo adjacent homology (BAH) domain-containing protein [Dioscorea alata]
MRPADSEKQPYVARMEKIEADHRNNVKVRVRWYYRPEESIGGRRQFHGAKELFLSDHYDVQSAHTIEGIASVRCLITRMISWFSVRDARTGNASKNVNFLFNLSPFFSCKLFVVYFCR